MQDLWCERQTQLLGGTEKAALHYGDETLPPLFQSDLRKLFEMESKTDGSQVQLAKRLLEAENNFRRSPQGQEIYAKRGFNHASTRLIRERVCKKLGISPDEGIPLLIRAPFILGPQVAAKISKHVGVSIAHIPESRLEIGGEVKNLDLFPLNSDPESESNTIDLGKLLQQHSVSVVFALSAT